MSFLNTMSVEAILQLAVLVLAAGGVLILMAYSLTTKE